MLVGIAGFARSGKDSASNVLCRGYGFTRVALADALRTESFQVFLPMLRAYVRIAYAPVCTNDTACDDMIRFLMVQHKDAFMRSFLQCYGTDLRRAENPNYWVERLDEHIKRHHLDKVCIPDVRFRNEANYITANGGVVVLMRRPGFNGNPEGAGLHESEWFADDETYSWDAIIEAENLKQLETKIHLWAGQTLAEPATRAA